MSEHTPGPWKLNWRIAGGGQHPDFPILHYVSVEGPDESMLCFTGYMPKADAYLLAAAPDLLAALKECADSLAILAAHNQPPAIDHPSLCEALAVIAKAEGQS